MLENSFLLRVRYADTDQMGVVYNGNYLNYFEIGRTELMRAYGLPYKMVEAQGYLLPLTEAFVKYLLPAKYDDELMISAKMDGMKGAAVKFEYEIKRGGDLLATGHTRHIFVTRESMKPIRPPGFFTEIVNKNMASVSIGNTL